MNRAKGMVRTLSKIANRALGVASSFFSLKTKLSRENPFDIGDELGMNRVDKL
jgi:hypothetical protein